MLFLWSSDRIGGKFEAMWYLSCHHSATTLWLIGGSEVIG